MSDVTVATTGGSELTPATPQDLGEVLPDGNVRVTVDLPFGGQGVTIIDPETGEIVGMDGFPNPDEDVTAIAVVVCEKLPRYAARKGSLKAEYDYLKKRLDAAYVPQIRYMESCEKWIKEKYRQVLEPFAKEKVDGQKRGKSFKFGEGGMTTLGFRARPRKVDVNPESEGLLEWARGVGATQEIEVVNVRLVVFTIQQKLDDGMTPEEIEAEIPGVKVVEAHDEFYIQ